MPIRKPADGRPQIALVKPAAAIAGGELTIRGKGFARTDRPRVMIGDVLAPVVIGSDSLVIARYGKDGVQNPVPSAGKPLPHREEVRPTVD